MGWFKKKRQKRTSKLVSDEIDVEVGKTSVRLTFADGRTEFTTLYGEACQDYSIGNDEEYSHLYEAYSTVKEPTADDKINVYNSEHAAKFFMLNLNGMERVYSTKEDGSSVAFGKVVAASIFKTEPHTIKFKKARVEKI